ncbi:hypothetical protein KKF91_06160, partial [Myxococcota bacterium]|nr:hypothetical protein [Myxococcota bacterium]MBU1430136.1 hypothetical protein [Myxococcota bacterium]MBU1896907.1 hypothetical protein [Myxococcota bacterium]
MSLRSRAARHIRQGEPEAGATLNAAQGPASRRAVSLTPAAGYNPSMPPLNHARAWRLLLTLSLSLMACAHPDLSAGRAALGGGRYEEATWAFERALADRDAAIDALRGLAAAYRGLGGQALRASDCTSARAHFALAAALS